MNKEKLLKLITNPIENDYFPGEFLDECKAFKDLDYNEPVTLKNEIFNQFRQTVNNKWHSWLEAYIQLNTAGKFPFLWPFSQSMIGFDFKYELDDFKSEDEFFSLGSDPSGDWFVMTTQNESTIHLCDHHVYDLYDMWINPNHLLAWAARLVIADENELTQNEILAYWDNRDDKVERETIERITSDLN